MKFQIFKKSSPKILSVIRILPGKKHALVHTNKGDFKKELKNIPATLLAEFHQRRV